MNRADQRQFVFGPVSSRRLGRSLGVDLVPLKTCCYDCIYCQLGRTTHKTVKRAEYAPVDEVVRQVHERLGRVPLPDYITLSGSGDPTVNCRLGDVVDAIKRQFNLPLAILTNGALFSNPQVRRECALADLVIPSLDAGDEMLFQYVNRPHADLTLSSVIEGLTAFRREFNGPIWLEVFLLAGVTDFPSEVEKIRAWADRIAPDRMQLNTAIRPPVEEFAFRVEKERLVDLAAVLGPKAEVIEESICRVQGGRSGDLAAWLGSKAIGVDRYVDAADVTGITASREEILSFLARRPSAIADIAQGLGVGCAEVGKCVLSLYANGEVDFVRTGRDLLFALAAVEPRTSQPVGAKRDTRQTERITTADCPDLGHGTIPAPMIWHEHDD